MLMQSELRMTKKSQLNENVSVQAIRVWMSVLDDTEILLTYFGLLQAPQTSKFSKLNSCEYLHLVSA